MVYSQDLGFDSRAGLRCVFSSDPAVSSSIFVGAEREENLIGLIIFLAILTSAAPPVNMLARKILAGNFSASGNEVHIWMELRTK